MNRPTPFPEEVGSVAAMLSPKARHLAMSVITSPPAVGTEPQPVAPEDTVMWPRVRSALPMRNPLYFFLFPGADLNLKDC